MKRLITYILIALPALTAAISCEKWLEATASDKMAAKDLFSDREGCLNALTGVYLLMGASECYGADYTWYANDLTNYPYMPVNQLVENADYHLQAGNFGNTYAQSRITAMWRAGYNVIANANMIIRQIEANPGIFTSTQERAMARGELYGVRAYIHFDLARMYGRANWAGDNAGKKTIPYMREYTMEVQPQPTYREFSDFIMEDLDSALTLLGRHDPIVTGDRAVQGDNEGYWSLRTTHLNYYACLALKARIESWNHHDAEAAATAAQVIEGMEGWSGFSWVDLEALTDRIVDPKKKDYTFPTEHIFSLFVPDAATTVHNGLYNMMTQFGPPCVIDEATVNDFFPPSHYGLGDAGIEDIRGTAFMMNYTGAYYTCQKHYCSTLRTDARMPLVKLSEMYLLIAENAIINENDPAETVRCLNVIRRHRGISSDIDPNDDPNTISSYFKHELYREFMCEGQLAYYKLRFRSRNEYNIFNMAEGNDRFLARNFLFPYPDTEKNYGRVQE